MMTRAHDLGARSKLHIGAQMSGLSDGRDGPGSGARRRRGRDRILATAFAAGAHLAIGVLLLRTLPLPSARPEPAAVVVSLVPAWRFDPPPAPRPPAETPKPAARPRARAAAAAARPAAPSPPRRAHPIQAPDPLPASVVQTYAAPTELTAAELAGAITAGGGAGGAAAAGSGEGGEGAGPGGGRGCDMVRRLQAALRRDLRVQAAVAQAHRAARPGGRALLVWNGDWVQSPGQDGKGLASLRQAIVMEVGFAPEACRVQPMRGLVLLSLNDAPGSAGVALGARDWRWSDLLLAGRSR